MNWLTIPWLVIAPLLLGALPAGETPLTRAADGIVARQDPDGALPTGARVVPYFANLAALGLAAAYRQTHNAPYLEAAKQWVAWYEAHQNPDGTIYDYTGAPGAWKATGDYDSTDSYAATYLELLQAISQAAPDRAWLRARAPSAHRAVEAIRLTLQPNGLTLAKPSWPVMYTMDNVETRRGLRAAAEISRALGETARGAEAEAQAAHMEAALGRDLWNADRQCYRVGIQTDGGKEEGLEKWYPDVMANLMAIGWLPPSDRDRALYARLKARFGGELPKEVRSASDLERQVWWGYAAQAAGDRTLLAQIRRRLSAPDSLAHAQSDPALLGHVCRLLAAKPPHSS